MTYGSMALPLGLIAPAVAGCSVVSCPSVYALVPECRVSAMLAVSPSSFVLFSVVEGWPTDEVAFSAC